MEDQILQIRAARARFDAESKRLRPDLHRFCTRMTGNVSDGEDIVQEALAHAYSSLPELREEASLRAWLFRVAHNCCIDWLRRRRAFLPLDEETALLDDDSASLEQKQLAEQALATIFTQLPPKERASVVLKDVLGYSLEEAAKITSSNVGAIKAALQRGRAKLEQAARSAQPKRASVEQRRLIDAYVERFNSRDWAGVRALLSEDARLEVVEHVAGPFRGTYFQNYSDLAGQWRLAWAEVEGLDMVVQFRRASSGWQPHSVLVLAIVGERVSLVRDYVHIDYLLRGARVVSVCESPTETKRTESAREPRP